MKTIWKVILEIVDTQKIEVPQGSKVLSVGMQHGKLAMWFLTDPESTVCMSPVRIYGTGHSDDDDPGTYYGSVQLNGGNLVFHVFGDLERASE